MATQQVQSHQGRRRLVVVTAAAVVAALAGVATWQINASDRSEVATPEDQQPTTATPEPAQQPTTATAGPDGDADPDESAIGDSEADSEPEGPCASAEGSLTQAPALEPNRHTVPAELAANPTIRWIEFDPGIGRVSGLTTVGDGRVLASPAEVATERTGPNATRTTVTGSGTLVATTDGVHWDELLLPEGVHPDVVNISSDPWLVTWRDRDGPTDRPHPYWPLSRVLISKDEGTTWTEVPIDPGPPIQHSVEDHFWVSSALVSDGRIVLSSEMYVRLDLGALLADRGLVPEGSDAAEATFAQPSGDSLAAVVETAQGLELVEFTLEELALTPGQRQALERRWNHLPNPENWGVRVYSGSEFGLEATADYEGYVNAGITSPGGFVLHVRRPDGPDPRELLIASRDGRSWSERPLDADGERVIGVTAAGAGLALWTTNLMGPYSRVQILCPDQSQSRDVTLDGVMLDRFDSSVSAGPGGFVAAALKLDDDYPPAEALEASLAAKSSDDSDYSESMAALAATLSIPRGDTWVGWSADGADWEWQDGSDVFGASPLDVDLAVGNGFLLAQVRPSGQGPSRWFIAEVPSG